MKKTIKLAIFTLILLSTTGISFGQSFVEYADSLYKKKDYKNAVTAYTKCYDYGKESSDPFYTTDTIWYCIHRRGMSRFQMKQYQEALSDFSAAIQVKPSEFSYDWRGRTNSALKQYQDAINDFSKAIQKNPISETYSDRGFAYFMSGKYQEAVNDFTKVIESQPKSADNYAKRAISYCKLGKKELAKSDEDTTIKLGGRIPRVCSESVNQNSGSSNQTTDTNDTPASSEIWFKLGNEQLEKKQFETAIRSYSKCLELSPERVECLRGRGKSYESANDFEKALADYTRVLEKSQSMLDYFAKGNVYSLKGDFQKAYDFFTEVISKQKDEDIYLAYLGRGEAAEHLNKTDLALSDYSFAAKQKPANEIVLQILGDFHYKRKNFDKAIDIYTEILKIKPQNPNILNNRGSAYLEKGLFKESFADADKAIKMLPTVWYYFHTRAEANCKLGKKTEARADEQKVIQLGGKVEKPCK